MQSLPHPFPLPHPAAVNLCTIQHPCCPVRVIPQWSAGKSSAPALQAPSGQLPHKFTTHTLFVMHCSTQGMRKVCGVGEVSQIPPHISKNSALLRSFECKCSRWYRSLRCFSVQYVSLECIYTASGFNLN